MLTTSLPRLYSYSMPPTSTPLLDSIQPDPQKTHKRPNPPYRHLERRWPVPIQLARTVVDQQTIGPDTKADTTIGEYLPYSPPPSLHAIILPVSTVPDPHERGLESSSRTSHPTGPTIAIALSAIFATLLCILGLIMILARFKLRKIMFAIKDLSFKPLWVRRSAPITKLVPTVQEDPVAYIRSKAATPSIQTQDTAGPRLESDMSEESKDWNTKSIESEMSEGPPPPPRIPPSVTSQECAMIGDGYCAPSMSGFLQRLEAEETDITLAIGIAMRDYTYPGSETGLMDEITRQLAVDQHGNNWDVKNRTRQGSDASESTQPTAESNVFSSAATTRSSQTSIREPGNDSDLEDMEFDEDINTEEMVFEVARAQTQSVEIKKGVLVNWNVEEASLSPILEDEMPERLQRLSSPSTPWNAQFPTVPSLVVTCPSMMTIPTIGPSFSSISVDLNEFPLPPAGLDCILFDKLGMCLPEIPEIETSFGVCR